MPTSRRNCFRSTSGASTRMPQTSMRPLSMTSSRSRQRSAVLLPEPLAPISATISPGPTSKDTPRSTWFEPKLLWTSCRLTMVDTSADIQSVLHGLAPARQRVAEAEIQGPDQAEHQEGLED